MSEILTEALLEMHFHSAIVEMFEGVFGARFLKLLKPSQSKEAWVGFDQGWVRTTMTTMGLYNDLKDKIRNGDTEGNFYVGYFLQFKVVNRMLRSSTVKPKSYKVPYYRTELSLNENHTTGLSQHETLLKLANIQNAQVYYACPMIFDLEEIYDKPDLEKLVMVPISSAPSGWATGTKHYITFQEPYGINPLWCSEPVKGNAFTCQDWVQYSLERQIPIKLTGKEVINLINDTQNIFKKGIQENLFLDTPKDFQISTKVLPESLTIMEFTNCN